MAEPAQSVAQRVKIRSYGKLRDLLGSEMEVEVPARCSIAQLRESIIRLEPDSARVLRSTRSRACVGDCLVDENSIVSPRDIVEFLPPVSGG